MFYYVYVLESKKDGECYTGFTDNLARRYNEHQKGKVIATRGRRPLELKYFEGYKDKRKALLREKYLKTGWGRNYLAKITGNAEKKFRRVLNVVVEFYSPRQFGL